MRAKEAGQRFRGAFCGNEVEVTTAGGRGELVCGGEPMDLMDSGE
ncbi:MAG: desulfoferrodoxin [Desulfobacteraceae bacterium]|nr:desulfoferrodoxin [Desulfobacteraceae bacterium]